MAIRCRARTGRRRASGHADADLLGAHRGPEGHLREAQQARADLAAYQSLTEQVRSGKHAYLAESTSARIEQGEMSAWAAFAEGDEAGALKLMRESADLQDKVGQGEVDIPAREMLADMLLELHRPGEALSEYERALELSPNRFNGLSPRGHGRRSRRRSRPKASDIYTALLNSTDHGESGRSELEHVKSFVLRRKPRSDSPRHSAPRIDAAAFECGPAPPFLYYNGDIIKFLGERGGSCGKSRLSGCWAPASSAAAGLRERLHFGIDVIAADVKPEMEAWIRGAVANAEPALARLTFAPLPPKGKLSFTTDLSAMAQRARISSRKTFRSSCR